MQALQYISARRLEWDEVADAVVEHEFDAILRPLAVAACDLDRGIVAGHAPFAGPFVLGHEFCGEITHLGAGVRSLNVGDVVLASFQPSCGSCRQCGIGHSSACSEGILTGMYGIGEAGGTRAGALAAAIRVPWAEFNLRKIPPGLSPATLASASDNFADGLRAVDAPLARQPGASVLIAGEGSIGLYAVLCAKFLGAQAVTFASRDATQLGIAERLGAQCKEIATWPKNLGQHDITLDVTNDPEGLGTVVRSTSPYGICTSGAIYFAPTTPMPLVDMYMKGIVFNTGRVNSASMLDRVIELIEAGLDLDKIEPYLCPLEDAIEGFLSAPAGRKLIFTS